VKPVKIAADTVAVTATPMATARTAGIAALAAIAVPSGTVKAILTAIVRIGVRVSLTVTTAINARNAQKAATPVAALGWKFLAAVWKRPSKKLAVALT
jgi:hypothetical protein